MELQSRQCESGLKKPQLKWLSPPPEPPPFDGIRKLGQGVRRLSSVMEERNLVQESYTNQSTSTPKTQASHRCTSSRTLKGMPWEPPKKQAKDILSSTLKSSENRETKSGDLNMNLNNNIDYHLQVGSYKFGSESKNTEKAYREPPCAQNMRTE